MNKLKAFERRKLRTRSKIKKTKQVRLCVTRSLQHICAQVVDVAGKVLASASTQEKTFKESGVSGGNIKAAASIGKLIAERASTAGIKIVAFDRAGYQFHGRVKALAEAARESGLEF